MTRCGEVSAVRSSGTSPELLIGDFYARLEDAEPWWTSPAGAEQSLRTVQSIYIQSKQKRTN